MKAYLVVAKYSMSIMLVCLLILILDSVLTLNLNQYGIVPRSTTHLKGFVIAPFLHANWAHLLSNFFPFIITCRYLIAVNIFNSIVVNHF